MQPCLAAAAGQFQRTFARPPPAANVDELNVHAHRSAHSYPAAVYLRVSSPTPSLPARASVKDVAASEQTIDAGSFRPPSVPYASELPAALARPVLALECHDR